MTSNTVNSNEDAPYSHARAGGNPNRRITALSYPFLKTQTLDSRLRGHDDGGLIHDKTRHTALGLHKLCAAEAAFQTA